MTKLTLNDIRVYESVTLNSIQRLWYNMFPKRFETRCHIKLGRYLTCYQEHLMFENEIDWLSTHN